MIKGLTARRNDYKHLAPEIRSRALALRSLFVARAGRNLPPWRYGLICAVASRMAQHGPPPGYNQRLSYRRAKKQQARLAELMTYGDPAAAHPVPLSEKEARKLVYGRKGKVKTNRPTG